MKFAEILTGFSMPRDMLWKLNKTVDSPGAKSSFLLLSSAVNCCLICFVLLIASCTPPKMGTRLMAICSMFFTMKRGEIVIKLLL